MSTGHSDRLVQMANQIARNLAAHGAERASAETAEHLARYWDPRMRSAILQADRGKLSPIARSAVELLEKQH